MENLVGKLESILSLTEVLEDEEKNKLEKLASEKMDIMDRLADELVVIISNLDNIDDKIERIEKNNRKQNILSKILFPYYWAASQHLEKVDVDENDYAILQE